MPTVAPNRMGRRALLRIGLPLLCALALSGCLLSSGERRSSDLGPSSGNEAVSFIGAEGEQTYTLKVAGGELQVIAIVAASSGELRLDVLDADGAVALTVQSRPDEQVTRSGTVRVSDASGLRYRMVARSARNGAYQVLYQQQEP